MPITEDASTPAVATGTATGTITTASFSPPANSLLVALAGGGWGNGALMAASVSDTGTHTWTTIAQAQGTSATARGVAAVFCTYLTSAPGAITVTASFTNLTGGRYLAVRVLNGAAAGQSSATGATRIVATTPADGTAGQITLTTTQAGSVVYGIGDDPVSSATFTVITGTTLVSSFVDTSSDNLTMASWVSSAATTTPGSVTLGGTWSAADMSNTAAFEVLPATPPPDPTLIRTITMSRAALR